MDIFDGRYEQEKLLGRGAFSEVWKVRDTQTDVTLALKIYNPTTDIDEDGNEMLTHEFALMVNANHKNLLRPLFFASCKNRPYLILPYCERGNIGKMVGKMEEEEAWKLIRDTASALSYLHNMKPPVLHQDIKPANILLNNNGDYMLTDFGVSTQVKQSLSRVSNQDKALLSAGTISYMAPERFSRNNLPVMANDIYSLGSTAYEMISGTLPFGNDGGLLQKKGAEIPEVPGDFSPLLKKTLDLCLQEDTWNRPTASQLEDIANMAIQHPASRYRAKDTLTQIIGNLAIIVTEKTEPEAKGTVIGAAFTEYNETVGGVSGQNYKGTVVGSAAPSIKGYILSLGDSKKKLIAAIAAGVLVLIAIVYFAFSGSSKESSDETKDNTESLQKTQEQAEYEEALNMFNQNDQASIQKAFNKMKVLADNGYKDAVFQVAYTYAWIPNDTESDRRKRLLGWKIIEEGPLKGQPIAAENNQEAINWLQKSIAVTDSADYRSMYWLAFYYLNGLNVGQDMEKASSLLRKAREMANIDQNSLFKEKIENTLQQLY